MDDDNRNTAILEQRLAGRSTTAIAKQYQISSDEVETVVDQRLLSNYRLDNDMRRQMIRLDLGRLDRLFQSFYTRALGDRDVPSGVLCVKILERRALLLGLDSPTRIDVQLLQAQEAPSSYARLRAAGHVAEVQRSAAGRQRRRRCCRRAVAAGRQRLG